MLKLVTELDARSKVFREILALDMPKDLDVWSLQKPVYKDLIDVSTEDIPELISLATNLDLFKSESDEDGWAVPIHAWRILGEMRAQSATLPLIERFDDYYECYWANDELPHIVANICGVEHIGKISNHLFDESRDGSSRIMAARTIKILADLYEDKKNEYIDILSRCLEESSQHSRHLNTMLVLFLVDLKAKSKIDNIRCAFQEGLIDSFFAGDIEDVEIDLGLREIRDTKSKHFLDLTPSDELHEHIKYFPERGNAVNNMTLINQGTKTGRNEPCHCGSGKKYKKCCLNIAEVNRLHKH